MEEAVILGMIQDLESRCATVHSPIEYEEAKKKYRPASQHRELSSNYKPLRNLKIQIKELRKMLDFLGDLKMEERSRPEYLMADFVELAQDLVDIDVHIDMYPVLNPETNYVEIFRFGQMLKTLRDDINMAKARIINFGADEKNVSVAKEEEKGVDVVVGLEEDIKQLVDRVISNELYGYPTLTIKGMIGIGKTTLAREVYDHRDVVGRFERRGWVSFCSDMSVKEVLVELIQQMVVGHEEQVERDYTLLEEKDNRTLRQTLRQHLKGKRFFIVVDNLLKGIQLRHILRDLHDEGYGNMILGTSCYASMDSNINYTHEMKPLDYDKSWKLFLKTIDKFTRDENKFSKEVEMKGREMLKKCGGLPLAIINVGRYKSKQRLSGIEWEELFDSIDLDESLKLLEPMYHKLDEKLKPCFLLMSFFKENAIMREEKLEHIWAASGVKMRSTLHERFMGQVPCAVLASESIIGIVHEFQLGYEGKRYCIHPLLRRLSIKKAEEGMGLEILKCNENNQPSQGARHYVVQCGREKLNHAHNQDNHLVSLIFHGGGRYLDDASQSFWKNFELLKILDMEDFGVKTLSETIGTFIELRYLGLRNNYIDEIPHSLGGLNQLEVFDIDLNFMVGVPDIFWKMGNLRNLHMSHVICQKPLKIDELQNLETLTYISIYDWTYEVSGLEMMTGLQKLGIEEVDENSDVGKHFASLAKLKHLDYLILRGSRFRSMPSLNEIRVLIGLRKIKLDGRLSRLPRANNFPQRITYLTLVNTCLDEDPMPVLEKLPELECLKLRNAYNGREMVIQRNWFPRLQLLHINELWNLRDVYVGEGAISALKQLEIKNCPHLYTLPEEIGLMKYLKRFKMVTTKHIAKKIRNSGLSSAVFEP